MKPYIINNKKVDVFTVRCPLCGNEYNFKDSCICGFKLETSRLHNCVQFISWLYKYHKIANNLAYYKEDYPIFTACFSGFHKTSIGYGMPEDRPLSDLDLIGYMMDYLNYRCWKYDYHYIVKNNIKLLVDEIIKLEENDK